MNGFFGKAFDLQSCWTGITAIATASVTTLGNHFINSKYNSKSGENPNDNC